MRIILKSLDSLKALLKLVTSSNRQALNDWFFNASDDELKQSIVLLNSVECLNTYPRHSLKQYLKFAQLILNGELPEPPTDSDLFSPPRTNPFSHAKACYTLYSILHMVTQSQLHQTFKKLSILSLIHSSSLSPSTKLQLTRPLASLSRILMSRIFLTLNITFSILSALIHPHRRKKFRTQIQKLKLKLKSVREMIKKGKINLEQRAFWNWVIVVEEDKFGKIGGLKEDFALLRSVGHSANLRYFHTLKSRFDHWRAVTPLTIHSLLSTSPDLNYRPSSKSTIKRHFKRKLEKKFAIFINCVYNRLETSFFSISQFAENQKKLFQQNFRLASIKPHIRNLSHIHRKLLTDALITWKTPQYEYAYEETVVTVLKDKINFCVTFKPIVLLEFHEGLKPNKVLVRNLHHILMRKLRFFWKIWIKGKENFILFGDDTLDLSIFKLNGIKCEKLKVAVLQLLKINETRKNLPRSGLNKWMQESNKRNLVVAKLKIIIQKLQKQIRSKKQALAAFKLNPINRTVFTDSS